MPMPMLPGLADATELASALIVLSEHHVELARLGGRMEVDLALHHVAAPLDLVLHGAAALLDVVPGPALALAAAVRVPRDRRHRHAGRADVVGPPAGPARVLPRPRVGRRRRGGGV